VTDATRVQRVRVSHIAARIHDELDSIGQPVAFAHRFATLEPVHGLPVSLPFGRGLEPDTDFWSKIAERRLSPPVSEYLAVKLRKAGVPLRYRGTLDKARSGASPEREAPFHVPRLEAHLHPFGVVAMTTVDVFWAELASLELAARAVGTLETEPVTVTIGNCGWQSTIGRAATDSARVLSKLLAQPGAGQTWDTPTHRLSTVISGVFDRRSVTMPTANSPLHVALHQLSAGDEDIADPHSAFVAQWTGAGYTWPPTNLVYMLAQGTSVLSARMDAATRGGQELRTTEQHRHLLLLLAYLVVSAGLVRAAQDTRSVLLPEWARSTAVRLGRLFGPGKPYIDWGLNPRALLLRIDASEDVTRLLGEPLTPNPRYSVADYRAAEAALRCRL
jgi:hypothetical protein